MLHYKAIYKLKHYFVVHKIVSHISTQNSSHY